MFSTETDNVSIPCRPYRVEVLRSIIMDKITLKNAK